MRAMTGARMSRDEWHPHAKGYRLWLGNGLWAEIRPVEHTTYTKRGKRTSRYWLGGVVVESIGRSCHACDAYLSGTADVRGFGHGYETRLLADAKRYAVGEAHAVGWTARDMAERHGARSFAERAPVASPDTPRPMR